jgi:TorA-specific chaperone
MSEQRALVYAWLSTLYAAEVPKHTLSSYLEGEAAPMFEGFSVLGLDAEAQRVQVAIGMLRDVMDAHLELAADFAQLFLLDAEAGALPYASAYDSEQTRLYGPAEARMHAYLAKSSLAIQAEFKEPADHLAVYLAVMAHVIEQHAHTADIAAAARDQVTFLHDALLGWLPKFDARNQRVSPRYDFYPALAALLVAFIKYDANFVSEVAKSPLPAQTP